MPPRCEWAWHFRPSLWRKGARLVLKAIFDEATGLPLQSSLAQGMRFSWECTVANGACAPGVYAGVWSTNAERRLVAVSAARTKAHAVRNGLSVTQIF